jgi:methylthioribose-1-phosphate isomerase
MRIKNRVWYVRIEQSSNIKTRYNTLVLANYQDLLTIVFERHTISGSTEVYQMLSPVTWNATENGAAIKIIKQTLLPDEEVWADLKTIDEVAEAIRVLDVRGAPAIGITAAFGCALAAHNYSGEDPNEFIEVVSQAADTLAATRPTAVNLFWALERMKNLLDSLRGQDIKEQKQRLLQEAQNVREEDIGFCRAIGRNGAELLAQEATVITHCNAGALATGGYGTALGVVRAAVDAKKKIKVYADETRPLLQGARLTCWELMREGISVTLICDNMAGSLMRQGKIDACIVGADRIAANGDAANKIGTYSLAVLARRHGIPFYVAAPHSTIDMSLPTGDLIPIEERDPGEITQPRGKRIAPEEIPVYNPAFDVTPNALITAIITERGVARTPNIGQKLKEMDQSS